MRNLLIVSFIILISIGCTNQSNNEKITVFTSILPQKYFVEKIAGNRVEVEVLVGPGKSPATYEPTPQQVLSLGKSKAFFAIGVPFENAFLPTIKKNLGNLKIINTAEGISHRTMEEHHRSDEKHDNIDHHHDEDKNHRNKINDPHIWLSPKLAKIQAENILKALIDLDPDGKMQYENSFNQLSKELDKVDKEISEVLLPFKGKTIFVFHPVLGYFADEYGLQQIAIETGGKEPFPAQLEEIIAFAKQNKAKIIFAQPEFSTKSAEKIADAIDGSVVLLDPLSPDYIKNLKAISTAITSALN